MTNVVMKINVTMNYQNCRGLLYWHGGRYKVNYNIASMILEILAYILLLVVSYTLLIYIQHLWSCRYFPKGPIPLPLIGNLHLVDAKKPHKSFLKLGEVYGDVFSISIGMKRVVIVNSIEPAQEALITKSEEFAGRPNNNYFFKTLTCNGSGMALSDYSKKQQILRSITVKGLKIFANRNDTMESKIIKCSDELRDRLMKQLGRPLHLESQFRILLVDFVTNILFGKENTSNDDCNDISQIMALLHQATVYGDVITAFPILEYFPMPVKKVMQKINKAFNKLIKRKYAYHAQNLDADDLKCLLDSILHSAYVNNQQTQSEEEVISTENVDILIRELLIAAVDTTVINLVWATVYLLHTPVYFAKAYQEIQHHLKQEYGDSTKYPVLRDRCSLPIVEAIIYESLRLTTGPINLPHSTTKDTSLQGFPLQKGTEILINMWSIHRDPKYFENPDKFYPERWIDSNGNFDSKLNKSYMPFGFRKRMCAGDWIARNVLFLVLTRMIVDFEIEPNKDEFLPVHDDGMTGLIQYPPSFTVLLHKRR